MEFGILALVLGVALLVVVLKFAIERQQSPWSDGALAEGKPTDLQLYGHSIAVDHLCMRHGRHGQERTYFTAYRISLPPEMAKLGIVDIDAQERWFTTEQYERIETSGSPRTSDDIFNGTFQLTSDHADASALELVEVREIITEISETCRGIWTRNGELCVLDDGQYSAAQAEVAGQYLVTQVERLRNALETVESAHRG